MPYSDQLLLRHRAECPPFFYFEPACHYIVPAESKPTQQSGLTLLPRPPKEAETQACTARHPLSLILYKESHALKLSSLLLPAVLGASLGPRGPWPLLAFRISVILEVDGTQKLQGCTLSLSRDATLLILGLLTVQIIRHPGPNHRLRGVSH